MSSAIRTSQEGADGTVAHIRVAVPPHNHLSASLLEELAEQLELLDNEPTCRAVMLSTDGHVFLRRRRFWGWRHPRGG